MKHIGTTIKKLRLKKQLSQTELAYLLELPSQSKISDWEKGIRIPSILEGYKLAQIFNVPIDIFFTDE
jgi:transcriptional regulator with XRE-family HTH domain